MFSFGQLVKISIGYDVETSIKLWNGFGIFIAKSKSENNPFPYLCCFPKTKETNYFAFDNWDNDNPNYLINNGLPISLKIQYPNFFVLKKDEIDKI